MQSSQSAHNKAYFRNAEYELFVTIDYTEFKNDDTVWEYFIFG